MSAPTKPQNQAPQPQPQPSWHNRLACPRCKAPLNWTATGCRCTDEACASAFPLVGAVPILINEQQSVFAIADFLARQPTTFAESDPRLPPKRYGLLRRLIPDNSRSVRQGDVARFIAGFPRSDQWVLVIGAGDCACTGAGHANVINTDVHLGVAVDLIADAHDLPFVDASLDAVIAIAVMEHVADPQRCAAEIVRVLKLGGRILVETPFMQQVHLGRYDFTRFTHLGHRRLWRHFREIESGLACGPGSALARAWQYFLLSFSDNLNTRRYLRAFAKLTSFPLPYVDRYLKDKVGALDAASSFYFIGEKLAEPVSDRAIIDGYRGRDSLR